MKAQRFFLSISQICLFNVQDTYSFFVWLIVTDISWFCPDDDCYYQISTNLMDEWLKKVNKQMWFIALFKGSLLQPYTLKLVFSTTFVIIMNQMSVNKGSLDLKAKLKAIVPYNVIAHIHLANFDSSIGNFINCIINRSLSAIRVSLYHQRYFVTLRQSPKSQIFGNFSLNRRHKYLKSL